ncbi:MAG: hypothetical protein LBG72_01970 [Spirochaetaceae bacterium]|jgi:hypothetical protein|nr:hypothetical protein [Spirochaetaceae bacterium]
MAVLKKAEGVFVVRGTGRCNNFRVGGIRIPIVPLAIILAVLCIVTVTDFYFVFLLPIIAFLWVEIKKDKEGIILDGNARTLSWPVFDIKNYIKGAYPRKEISLDKILSLDEDEELAGSDHNVVHYSITLTGEWGTKKFWFPFSEDRTQFCALLANSKKQSLQNAPGGTAAAVSAVEENK